MTWGFEGGVRARLRRWGPAALLVAMVVACYANTLHNPFLYDDVVLVLQNPEIRSLSGVAEAIGFSHGRFVPEPRWTRTVVYALQYAAVGTAPWLYHATNLALHAVVVLLLFALATRLTRDRALGWWAAALFAVHPVLTDVVAPIAGLRGLLAALFALAALLLLERYRRSGGLRWVGLAALCLWLSVASKEVGAVAIAAFVIIELYRRAEVALATRPGVRLPEGVRLLLGSSRLGYVALALVAALMVPLLAVLIVGDFGRPSYYDALGTPLDPLDRARLVGTGLRLLLAPIGQSVDYFYDALQLASPGLTPLEAVDLALVALLGVTTGLGLWRLSWLGFGGAWFLVFLAPTMGFISWHEVFAERFLYLPAAGVAIALASAGVRLSRRPGWQAPLVAVGVIALLVLGAGTVARNRVWSSEVSLWQDAVDRYPSSARAQKGLANAHRDAGRFERALEHYEAARRILPAYQEAHVGAAEALLHLGRPIEAQNALSTILTRWPESAPAWFLKGSLHDQREEADEAIAAYRRTLELDPRFAPAYNNLGRRYAKANDLSAALQMFLLALEHDPAHEQAMRNLAVIYRLGFRDIEQAERYEERARRLAESGARIPG